MPAQDFFNEIKGISLKESSIFDLNKNVNRSYSDYDLCYQRMEWSVDPAIRNIQGKITSYFKSVNNNTISQIDFDLSDSLIVDSIKQRNSHLIFEHAEDRIKIFFTDNSVFDSVSVYYHGVPVNSGFGSFEVSKTPFNKPVLWTLSEPYGAMEWWPCKQSLFDKVDSIDILVTVPKGNKVASNGILLFEKENNNGTILFHWRHRHPISTYLIAMAVTDYSVYSDTVALRNAKMPIVNFVYPPMESTWRKSSGPFKNIIQYFDSLLIPYPYSDEKYGHAQFGWGGGMEHQTMSFMVDLGEGLMAHELAHQWFGNHNTCGSWQDIWLNEGFATYLTGLYYERFKPQQFIKWKKDQINYILSSEGGSVYVYDTSSVNRIFDGRLSYAKGAMVLNMLRKELGEDVFFQTLRNYLNASSQMKGFVRSDDLRQYFEKASGKSLKTFFDQWVYKEGYNNILLEWNASDDIFSVSVRQKPSHPSNVNYEMKLPLLLKGENRDTLIFLDMFKESSQWFYNVGFRVLDLIADPEFDFLSRYETRKINGFIADKDQVKVFPNPVSEYLSVELNNPENIPENVQLIDLSGRRIRLETTQNITGKILSYDLKGLSSGSYQLQLYYPEKIISIPFVKL